MPVKEKLETLIGKTFNQLTILADAETIKNRRIVLALCSCGKTKKLPLAQIKNGSVKSCGCRHIDVLLKRNTTHGLCKHPLNRVWSGMKERCYYQKANNYYNYGGRGISVCKEWIENFYSFYDWAISNGWQKGLHVDRFPNQNGNYEPSNCRIVTRKVNNRNTRVNHIIEYNGKSQCLNAWAEELGIHRYTIYSRICELGWTVKQAFETPVKQKIKRNADPTKANT